VRAPLTRFGGKPRLARIKERRIGYDETRALVPQTGLPPAGGAKQIGLEYATAIGQPILRDIRAGEAGNKAIAFQEPHLRARTRDRQSQACGPDTSPDIDSKTGDVGRCSCREQHRIRAASMPAFRLVKQEAAAKKGIGDRLPRIR
jgi:hypothetical protein